MLLVAVTLTREQPRRQSPLTWHLGLAAKLTFALQEAGPDVFEHRLREHVTGLAPGLL